MSSSNHCKDGSNPGFWSATKSLFRTVGCGINTMASAAEGMASATEKWAIEAEGNTAVFLVETLGITFSNGHQIEDHHLAKLISDSYKASDYHRLSQIAQIYNLNMTTFIERQRHLLAMRKLSLKGE